jgi:hypothetical protein
VTELATVRGLAGTRHPTAAHHHSPSALGRVGWAGSLDPVFGARLHALAARIDWS